MVLKWELGDSASKVHQLDELFRNLTRVGMRYVAHVTYLHTLPTKPDGVTDDFSFSTALEGQPVPVCGTQNQFNYLWTND